jgi:hypothetical protein
MFFIPGFIIAWATFPGVIVHEFAHKLACERLNIKVFEVKYFIFSIKLFGGEAGHVIHEKPKKYLHSIIVGVAPLFLNTTLMVIFAVISKYTVYGNDINIILLWLAFSMGVNAFPSDQDMDNVRQHDFSDMKSAKFMTSALYYIMRFLNFGKMFWLDFIYAFVVIASTGALAEFLKV